MNNLKLTETPKKNAAAQALGALGGAAGTAAQNAARKRNAQKAGRPRRICKRCKQPVVGGHLDRALDDSCGAHGWRWQRRVGGAGRPRRACLRCGERVVGGHVNRSLDETCGAHGWRWAAARRSGQPRAAALDPIAPDEDTTVTLTCPQCHASISGTIRAVIKAAPSAA